MQGPSTHRKEMMLITLGMIMLGVSSRTWARSVMPATWVVLGACIGGIDGGKNEPFQWVESFFTVVALS